MTSPDSRIHDLTALERSDVRQSRPEHSAIHLLRLVLDLQLDAMLLTLGASAYAESRGEPEHRTPWKRWLVEDLDLARALATTLVDGDGAPVTGLGGSLAHVNLDVSLANLTARFENMDNLLVGVLDRPSAGEPWWGIAGEALHRCRARLAELRRHSQQEIVLADFGGASSLPGEWLG